MKLTDDQIRSIMEKKISCKTVLVDNKNIDAVIDEHTTNGWKLVNKIELNGRTKLTFDKLSN